MPESTDSSSKRVLDPFDRVSEVLFGLIMVLTFTGSLSIAESGREDIRTMLVAALGCNLAWGVIDAVFYLMGCLAERNRNLTTLRSVQEAPELTAATRLVARALPPLVAAHLPPAGLSALTEQLRQLPKPAPRARLHATDWAGAGGVFLLVFLSTFPVVLPFLFMSDGWLALRISNGIAIAMLFTAGRTFGMLTGWHPFLTGVALVLLGGILVGLTIALGG